MSFAGKWMEPEIIIINPNSEGQISHFLSYAKSRLKKKT
jgi:hypothetical protein